MARQDYDIPGLTAAIKTALEQGEEPVVIYNRITTMPPTEWGAGAGVDTRRQTANVLREQVGWSPALSSSSFAGAPWGP